MLVRNHAWASFDAWPLRFALTSTLLVFWLFLAARRFPLKYCTMFHTSTEELTIVVVLTETTIVMVFA